MRVERQRLHWPILDAVREAAEEIGIPKSDDFNLGDNDGSGYFEVTQRSGIRWSAARAFLPPQVRKRPNLRIIDRAQVTRLVLEGGRVVGIEYEREGRVSAARAARQVVMAAGAIGTPQILMLSGLGPAAQLKEHGIEVLHDMPGVGANLQDHLQIRTSFRINGARTLNDMQASLWGKARIAAQYALSRSGPMAMSPSQLGMFTRSHPRYATPNVEFHVQPLSLDAFGEPLHTYPALTVSVCNLRPNSVGSVRLASASFRDAPVIAPNYLSDQEDRDVAADSIRLARRLMATRRMAGFQPVEEKPGAEVQSEEELTEAAGRIATTIFHPVGTAKMGPEGDRMAVVSPTLAVRGIGGLTIADASVMPRIVSGNTHAPVVMIAERAATHLMEMGQ
jgi:choline dehydrogenase